jgi:flagellar hook-associated protein 2
MGTIGSTLSAGTSVANTPVTASNSGSSSSSSSTGSTSTNSTGIFTGTSAYSEDLQNVVSRAVAIATLPIDLLTDQQTLLSNQETELTTLGTDFTAVQTSVQAIQDALGGSSMQTSVSTPSVASVTLGDGAVAGDYSINVSDIGAYATSLSSQAWNAAADSSGQTTTYNLVVGGNSYSFTPSDNSAATVASTINSQYGGLVQATAVNVGSSSNPDYRISLQSTTLGAQDLDIQIPAQGNLQTAQASSSGYALSQTASTWDSSGGAATYTLVVDGTDYTVTPADNSASSVAAAINALTGDPVRATVVDLGSSGSPDYRIQLQATSAGVSNVDLQDSSGTSLQQQETPVAAGSAASQTAGAWDATPDPSGNPTQYTLSIGRTQQSITVDDNSATGVAAAINALSGSGVQATVVNLGTDANPEESIQLVNTTGSSDSPQLTRSTAFDLQTQGQPPGSLAQYEVANSGKTVTSDSRSVLIAAGTTLTLTGAGSTNVTVTQSVSALSSALSGFADAYNAAVAELAKQRGQTGGALQGDSIVNSLSRSLASMSTYRSSTGTIGMADLGFTLNDDGTLTYNAETLLSTEAFNPAGVTAFLGSSTGGGFLQAATNALGSMVDPTTGMLPTTESAVQSQITSLGNTISTKQAQVDQLQTQLTNEMAQADAAIATMEQQYSYMTSMFAAMQTADQMYAKG